MDQPQVASHPSSLASL